MPGSGCCTREGPGSDCAPRREGESSTDCRRFRCLCPAELRHLMSLRMRPVAGLPAQRPSPTTVLASAVALIVYALAIPLAAAVGLDRAPSTWMETAGILVLLSVYSGTRIAYELGRVATRSFVLIFHSFAYVFLGVVPVVQIGAGTLWWAVDPTPDALIAAAVVCLIGVLTFDLGLWTGSSLALRRAKRADRARQVAEGHRLRRAQRLAVQRGIVRPSADRALAFLLALSLLSLVVLWARGGLALVFASRSEMDAALCSVGPTGDLAECGVVTALVRVPSVILIIVALALRNRAGRSIAWLAIITGFVGLVVTANPVSTPRFWSGAAVLGVLGVLAARSTRSRVFLWLALPALLILVFPSLDFGRSRDWTATVSIQTDAIVQKQDFDAFQQVANGITYVDVYGTRGGTQISSALLFFVPRSLWGDKAPATGPLVTASLGVTSNTNVSAPLWEEAYVDFGLGGVVVILCLFGYLIANLESAVQSSAARGGGLIIAVAPFFAGLGVFVLRGSLLPAMGPLAVAILLTLAVRRLGTQHEQGPRAWAGSAGTAAEVHVERAAVFDPAHGAHPERRLRRPPTSPPLPRAAWINKPKAGEATPRIP